MISWPCILKLDGDDELVYLASESDLNSECSSLILCPNDRVIDSVGNTFSIIINDAEVNLVNEQVQVTAEQASKLIQSHEFCRSEVCLTKIQVESVFDAINCLKSRA
ncbi:TPA: DUF4144 domain-containing protein [Vibrio parahaemolyticus]|nr:DUF4144 domain-containing protein [Vibrio parahaemolyticus]